MEAIEFNSEIHNGSIKIPENIKIDSEKKVRVIVLYENEEKEFIELTQKEFLEGYDEGDSIYDEYK